MPEANPNKSEWSYKCYITIFKIDVVSIYMKMDWYIISSEIPKIVGKNVWPNYYKDICITTNLIFLQ